MTWLVVLLIIPNGIATTCQIHLAPGDHLRVIGAIHLSGIAENHLVALAFIRDGAFHHRHLSAFRHVHDDVLGARCRQQTESNPQSDM